jgi:hypothetical protein
VNNPAHSFNGHQRLKRLFDFPLHLMARWILLLLFLVPLQMRAQDVLLLTNGKYRKLKGKVVYIDQQVVLWQTAKQESDLREFEAEKAAKLSSPSRLKREEELADRKHKKDSLKLAKGQAKLEKRRKVFESEIEAKIETLSPADFERWKIRELDRLKKAETDRRLKIATAEKLASMKQQKKEAKERGRFSNAVSRELVFSYMGPDSLEKVVYNADTLGFLADGDAEVEWGVEDMRKYIQGRQDGRRHPVGFDAALGAGIGTLGAFFGAFWGPSVPAGYVLISSIANVKVKTRAKNIDPDLITHPAYLDGYERSARNRKTMTFVQGAVAGLGFGFIMYQGVFRQ